MSGLVFVVTLSLEDTEGVQIRSLGHSKQPHTFFSERRLYQYCGHYVYGQPLEAGAENTWSMEAMYRVAICDRMSCLASTCTELQLHVRTN